jgi:hypothetical protein
MLLASQSAIVARQATRRRCRGERLERVELGAGPDAFARQVPKGRQVAQAAAPNRPLR